MGIIFLFLENGPKRLHFAISSIDLLNLGGHFCGKNPKNKSYRMPFNVKKCKLFHFSFPKIKHSDRPRAPIISRLSVEHCVKSTDFAKCLQVFK
jgi:hypothetical protein